MAAYRSGEEWLTQVLAYLQANRDYVYEYVNREMPQLHVNKPEGTYLAWIDCRDASLPGDAHEFFLKRAGVALMDGKIFGQGGEGFVRLNFGCQRATLTQALERMKQALTEKDK